jgi:hypothetical protein
MNSTAIPECCKHVTYLHGALAFHVRELPAKGNHDFRVLVGEGRELRVSIVPNFRNPGGIVETLLFDSKGRSARVVGDEEIDRDRDGDGVRRFFVGGGGHVEEIAAHIKALREHFGWVGAGGAAAARSVFDDTDQDSDRTDDNMRAMAERIDAINSEQKDSDKGDSDQEVRRCKEMIKMTDQERWLTKMVDRTVDTMRAMAERTRGLEELVHAQQEQMRLMSESMSQSFEFINKKLTTASK